MMQRAPRYAPLHARMIRLEAGPPMYRMLGYADKNNMFSDLCDPPPPGFYGPFSLPRLPSNQSLYFGPGRFGLPSHPLAFTTHYWDDRLLTCDVFCLRNPCNKLHYFRVPETRPEVAVFPEMAVPGSGVQSRSKDSGYLYKPGLPPPVSYGEPETNWYNITLHSDTLYI